MCNDKQKPETEYLDHKEWSAQDDFMAKKAKIYNAYYCRTCGKSAINCNTTSYQTVAGKRKSVNICIHCNHIMED